MGKYPHSKLHSFFSNWHWKKCKPKAWLCDIDRIWVELRGKGPIAVFDLKTENDKLTPAGERLGRWFENHDVPFYVVTMKTTTITTFVVYRPKTDGWKSLSENQMIKWIDNDLQTEVIG